MKSIPGRNCRCLMLPIIDERMSEIDGQITREEFFARAADWKDWKDFDEFFATARLQRDRCKTVPIDDVEAR